MGGNIPADRAVELLADDIALPALPDGLPRFLYVAWVTGKAGATFTVQVHVFPVSYRLPEPFALGVHEETVDRMRSLVGGNIPADRAVELLADDIALPALPDGLPRFLYV
ncbi:hypothetical protein CTI14_56725, partial [Methylobacterium radiotolerans]